MQCGDHSLSISRSGISIGKIAYGFRLPQKRPFWLSTFECCILSSCLNFTLIVNSYKEFGNSHWWELIEIFVPKFGIWFSSLFPKWELIPTGIPTGRNWLKSLFWDLVLQLLPKVGIYSHRNSRWWELVHRTDSITENWWQDSFHHYQLANLLCPIRCCPFTD